MIIEAASLSIDLSLTPISSDMINQFKQEAERCELQQHKTALFSGEKINSSESRAAHHTALRAPNSQHPNAIEARETREHYLAIAEKIRAGQWFGATGQAINTVVNIGIGGSDLGPRMVNAALSTDNGIAVRYIANIDPAEMDEALSNCKPETTLFIIASKSFSTLETLENGLAAKRWLLAKIPSFELNKHVIAITSNIQKATEFGVDKNNILPMWDWVGGRYSLWSAIGLPIAIAIGSENYLQLLNGAHAMDQHFFNEDLNQNAPTLLAQLEISYIRQLGLQSLAVLPYSHKLRLLPDYLQQLCMESNGKQTQSDGSAITEPTCPIVWGSAGTVGQHSFHQLLHQGTQQFAADFILPTKSNLTDLPSEDKRHLHLIANCHAQRQALHEGKPFEQALKEVINQGHTEPFASQLAKQKVISGNKPNTLITMETVNPFSLGALIALYEHKTFVQACIWGINPFDQWGVELGKQLSKPIFDSLNPA